MRGSRSKAFIALLSGLALVAAACGGGGSGEDADESSIDSAVANEVKNQLYATTAVGLTSTTAVRTPTTMEEWLKLWETERAGDCLINGVTGSAV